MATTRKINILPHEELIRRARDADPAQAGRGDAEVIGEPLCCAKGAG
jgi:hypothetical protein